MQIIKPILTILLLLTFASCQNANTNTQEETKIPTPEEVPHELSGDALEKGCYAYEDPENAIHLEITNIDQGKIQGALSISYFEKDKNTGTFSGTFNGQHLLADYTFMSEGIESVRQVAFLFHDGLLVEGYGEMTENGTEFKDVKNINYTSEYPLIKVECPPNSI